MKTFFQMGPEGLHGPYIQPGHVHPQSPYSVPVVPIHDSGICELILVIMVLLLWLYSFYRLYLVWQKTLNFSEASIQGPQGWDLLVNWVYERIQVKKMHNIRSCISFLALPLFALTQPRPTTLTETCFAPF